MIFKGILCKHRIFHDFFVIYNPPTQEDSFHSHTNKINPSGNMKKLISIFIPILLGGRAESSISEECLARNQNTDLPDSNSDCCEPSEWLILDKLGQLRWNNGISCNSNCDELGYVQMPEE